MGVGDYFLDSILSDLDSLILFAGVHPDAVEAIPFGIYYEVEDELICVYAILDLRRDPWIRKRLQEKVDKLRNFNDSPHS